MITIATDEDTLNVDGDLSMTLENLKAILEADTSTPPPSQQLYCNGKLLSDDKASLSSLGVKEDDLLMLHKSQSAAQSSGSGSTGASAAGARPQPSTPEQEAEALRQEMLSNAPLMAQLRSQRPELAEAVNASDPTKFIQMLRAERERNQEAQRQAMALANADEFDIDAQRRIEEAIRQEQVMENFGSAMEFNPESFGRVTMLYVETQVNGHPIKAFVDSGAQATIMSPECAEKCGIMRLIDTRFAGIARGVGTAKILGRVHSAQIKLGDDLFLPCSFTIMEGRTTELLFGLDMLKRHSCLIDLAKNALVVHGRNIRFLDEHELPPSARGEGLDDEEEEAQAGPAGHAADKANANAAASAANAGQSFPGQGNTLGNTSNQGAGQPLAGMSWDHKASQNATSGAPQSSPSGPAPSTGGASSTQQSSKSWPAASLQALKDLGASDVQAKAFLDAAGGNVEVAASLLFQQ